MSTSSKPAADLHVVIAGPRDLEALRLLIAMDFGLGKMDDTDASWARRFRLGGSSISVAWPGTLDHDKTRLQLLFSAFRNEDAGQGDVPDGSAEEQDPEASESPDSPYETATAALTAASETPDVTPDDTTAETEQGPDDSEPLEAERPGTETAATPDGTDDAHSNGPADAFASSDNQHIPFTDTAAAKRVPPSKWVAATLTSDRALIFGDGRVLRGPERVNPLSRRDQLLKDGKRFVSSVAGQTNEVAGTVERHIVVHLCDYRSVPDALATAKSWPKRDPASRSDVSLVFYWPQTPLAPPEVGDLNLTADFERSVRALQVLSTDADLIKPLPLIVATGECALSASLVSARTTDRDATQRGVLDQSVGPRVIEDAWQDPVELARSMPYLSQQSAFMLSRHGKMLSLIREAMRSDVCMRIVPIDVNGVDLRRQTLATTFRPHKATSRHKGTGRIVPGLPISSLFDPMILRLAVKLKPKQDIWDREAGVWLPLRTASVWFAALARQPHQPLDPLTIEAEIACVYGGRFDLPLRSGQRAVNLYWK